VNAGGPRRVLVREVGAPASLSFGVNCPDVSRVLVPITVGATPLAVCPVAEQLGRVAVLEKPFTKEQLLATIKKVL
jgi:hypothetical protein